MFEAKLVQASLLKKLLDATKDVVVKEGANWECTGKGISCQAMDSSHVTLLSILLRSDGFDNYRCDRNVTLGINFDGLSNILKCAGNDDVVTMKAEDSTDLLGLVFESPKQEKVSEYQVKLVDIDADHLAIPDTEYNCVIKMPSAEFQRVCPDLSQIGECIVITCTKDGVKFSVSGDLGQGSITLRQNCNADKEEDNIEVTMQEPVSLTFSIRYLNYFTKATPLSPVVSLSLQADAPLALEYQMADMGYVRFYLAPKVEDE